MSKGIGKIQQQCLAALRAHGEPVSAMGITGRVLGKNLITFSEGASFRRALRGLCARGLAVDMGPGYRWGRSVFATPEAAKASLDKEVRMFPGHPCTREKQKFILPQLSRAQAIVDQLANHVSTKK